MQIPAHSKTCPRVLVRRGREGIKVSAAAKITQYRPKKLPSVTNPRPEDSLPQVSRPPGRCRSRHYEPELPLFF